MNTRICDTCKIEKSLDCFYQSKNSDDSHVKNGRYRQCKDCRKERQMKQYKNNVENNRLKNRSRYADNKVDYAANQLKYRNTLKGRMNMWKKRAKRSGLKWSLTLDDILKMPLICGYTYTDLTLDSNKLNTVSLDRIDSSKGYVLDNVVFCCQIVNKCKHELSVKQFVKMCESVVANKTKILSLDNFTENDK